MVLGTLLQNDNSVLFLKTVAGLHKGKPLTLPRVQCSPGDKNFPIVGFTRLQFPVRVRFAMTINEAQGQSISGRLRLDLRHDCFSHGQLYVALSRATHPKNIFVCTAKGIKQTKNVVYPEAITLLSACKIYSSQIRENSYPQVWFHFKSSERVET